jgi:hypothetical protein
VRVTYLTRLRVTLLSLPSHLHERRLTRPVLDRDQTRLPKLLERTPLTPRARAWLRKLQGDVQDAHALQETMQARYATTENALMIARNNLGVTDPQDKRHRDRLAAEVEALEAQLVGIERERSGRNAALWRSERALQTVQSWLPGLGEGPVSWGDDDTRFIDIDQDAQPREGESLTDAISRLRSEIAQAQNQLHWLRVAPPPRDAVRAAIVSQIGAMARQGAPRFDFAPPNPAALAAMDAHERSLLALGNVVKWPDTSEFATSAPGGAASKILCWLFKGRIESALLDDLAELPDEAFGPPMHERLGLEREMRNTIRDAELEEEALIQQAEAAGNTTIERRSNADPMIILGIAWAGEVAAEQGRKGTGFSGNPVVAGASAGGRRVRFREGFFFRCVHGPRRSSRR